MLKSRSNLSSNLYTPSTINESRGPQIVPKANRQTVLQRNQQLSLITMLSLVKLINKKSQQQQPQQIKTKLSLEKQSSQFLSIIQTNIRKVLQKQSVKQKENNHFKTSYSEFRRSQGKQTIRQLRIRKQRSQIVCRYERECRQFQKLNTLIDKIDNGNIVHKSIEYLTVLKGLTANLKTIIYKYFKRLKDLEKNHIDKVIKIKFFCNQIFVNFKDISSLIKSLIDKNENYHRFEKKYEKYEIAIQPQDSVIRHFQVLLLNFNSINQLSRLYGVSNKLAQVSQKSPQNISQLIRFIIKVRHLMGYLTKEIINSNVSLNQSKKGTIMQVNQKDVWKTIYEKKYQSTTYKKRLRLQ